MLSKYDASGAEVWSRLLDSDDDFNIGTLASGANGELYLFETRRTPQPGTNSTRMSYLSKYSPAGDKLWSRPIGSNSVDIGFAIAVDQDSIYIAGNLQTEVGGTNAGSRDAFLRKFSTDGEEVWSRNVGRTFSVKPNAIAIDAAGSIYISGAVARDRAGELPDAFLAKYSTEGDQVWINRTNDPYVNEDYNTVSISPAGEVVTIYRRQTSDWYTYYDAFLRKHSETTGQVESTVNAIESVLAAPQDEDGNLYLSTQVQDSGPLNAVVRKYSASEDLLWEFSYGTSDLNWVDSIARGGNRSIYVAGTATDAIQSGVFLVRLTSVPEPTAALSAWATLTLLVNRRGQQR